MGNQLPRSQTQSPVFRYPGAQPTRHSAWSGRFAQETMRSFAAKETAGGGVEQPGGAQRGAFHCPAVHKSSLVFWRSPVHSKPAQAWPLGVFTHRARPS